RYARRRGRDPPLRSLARRPRRRGEAAPDRPRDGRGRDLRALPRARARDRDARDDRRVGLRHGLRHGDGRAARRGDRPRPRRSLGPAGERPPVGSHRRRDDRRRGAHPLDRLTADRVTASGPVTMRMTWFHSGIARRGTPRSGGAPRSLRYSAASRAVGLLAAAAAALTALLATLAAPGTARAQEPTRAPSAVVGDWLGTLAVPGGSL